MSILTRTLGAIALSTASIAMADPFLSGAKQVSAGLTHTCALLRDGTVACWGSNSVGELGDGTRTKRATPARVRRSKMPGDVLDQVTQVVAAAGFSCALMADESVTCWGDNNVGELGNTSAGGMQMFPIRVAIAERVKSIAAAGEFACALLDTAQRSIRCWGDNYNGQLGDGTKTDRPTPTDVVVTERDGSKKLLAGITSIAAGSNHTCAVLDDTSVACWGFNWTGELGDGTYSDSVSPVAVVSSTSGHPKLTGIESVSANGVHTCARYGTTWMTTCWGNNSQGQLGNPAAGLTSSGAVDVALGIRSVDAGQESTCAMLADYRIACWGGNGDGQLGTGTTAGSDVPIILGPEKITSLSVGTYHACAVLPDTTIECWGQGRYGQLGNGSFTEINPSPARVVDF